MSDVLKKITGKIYKTSEKNEVKAQVNKAKGKKVATSEGVVKNIISGKKACCKTYK